METQTIVDELAQAIGRPITLEDAGGRLLAYSVHEQPVDHVRVETLLRRGASSVTLDALRARGVYQFVDSCDGLARVPPIPELGFSSRVCLAIWGSARVLGYLWVVDPDSSLSRAAEEMLLRARRQLAVELARRDSAIRAGQEQRSSFIAELCGRDHAGEEALARQAKALGWYYTAPLTVILVRWTENSAQDPVIPAVLEDLLCQRAPASLRGVLGGEVVVVLSGRDCQLSKEISSSIVSLLPQSERSACVGAGGTYENLSGVRRSYLEAASAISLGRKMDGSERHFDYHTLAPYELLSCMSGCKKAGSYGREPVEKVVTYDGLHGGNLFRTLEAFLDYYGRRKMAATRLNIHPNTLDYRIGKIRELTGLDLDDPNTRLVVHLWVKALSPRLRG
ncbi:MAG: PucR family transcriptional regulator [Bacillota bacterium]